MSISKWRCRECGAVFTSVEILRAPNPFSPTEEIDGCPNCKAVEATILACDEPGCMDEATMGTPMPAGYRDTCWKHRPIA